MKLQCMTRQSIKERGFSLAEVLVAMAISSILLLSAARFLPALQWGVLRQMRQNALEDEVWQRIFTVAKQLQRAGFCQGSCRGEPLKISPEGDCVIVQWDANSNGRWETTPTSVAEQTGFRLQNGVLETLRGATSCEAKGWDKMTDPDVLQVSYFNVRLLTQQGYAPQLVISLTALLNGHGSLPVSGVYRVTGYNL